MNSTWEADYDLFQSEKHCLATESGENRKTIGVLQIASHGTNQRCHVFFVVKYEWKQIVRLSAINGVLHAPL